MASGSCGADHRDFSGRADPSGSGTRPAVSVKRHQTRCRTAARLDLAVGRLKTGTPARLDGRTIDWDALEMQPADDAVRSRH